MGDAIAKDHVVEFHYTLFDTEGAELETTRNEKPAAILHGHRNVIPGLEAALTGRQAGDSFEVDIPTDQAYGQRRDDWTQRVSKKYFAKPKALKAGQITQLRLESGPRPVTVIKVGAKMVDVDLNHPQAGNDLHFAIEIVAVRKATPQELSHGHAHSGGHDH